MTNFSFTEVRKNKKSSPKKHKSSKQPKNKHPERPQKEDIVSVDESDEDTKYNIVQRKMKQDIHLSNARTEILGESDSESIFEVPISPKPKPLFINLQDSDDEDAGSSLDEDDLLEGRLHGKNVLKGDSRVLDLKFLPSSKVDTIEVSLDHQDTVAESNIAHKSPRKKHKTSATTNDKSAHTHQVHEDIVLNCTMVQKGARNINEIKQMSKSAKQDRIETSVEGTSLKKNPSQDTSRGNSPDVCASWEMCQTSQGQGIETGEQTQEMQQNVCDVRQTCETDETQNTCVALMNHLRYAVRTLENTLLEVSCGANNNLVMSQKRRSEGNSEGDEGGGEDGDSGEAKNNSPARKRQCTIQQNDQLNVALASRSSVKKTKRSSSFWADYFFAPLPETLKKFYNDSRGQENFNVKEIQRGMPKDPRRWAILDEDLMPSPAVKRGRYWSTLRCTYCQRDGHIRKDCPEPRKIECCHMCGKQGHITWRCPQQICLTCGKKQNAYLKNCEYCRILYCTMCYSVGHKKEDCPDLWRRYHSVTREIGRAPRNPGNVMKPASQLHCCNCSKRGHESSTCKEYRWSMHFPTPAFVTNYTEGPVYELENVSEKISMNTETPDVPSSKTKKNKTLHGNTPGSQATSLPPNVDASSSSSVTAEADEETYALSAQEQMVTISEFTMLKFANVMYCCGNFRSKNNQDARALVSNLSQHKKLCREGKQLLQNRFSNGTVLPIFLRKLRKIVEFEVMIGLLAGQSEVMVQLMAPEDCIHLLFHLLLHWLNLPLTEKQHGLDLNLPTQVGQMCSFLAGRNLCKLSKEIKNPMKLYITMNSLKDKLRTISTKNKLYFHNQTNLWSIQVKLLEFINTHPEPSAHFRKITSYMETLKYRAKNDQLDAPTYLNILISYNNIYTPHTPPNLQNTLQRIWTKQISTKVQGRIQEQQLLSNVNVNFSVPFTSSSCTPQETDTVVNPFSFGNVSNVPDDMSNVIDIENIDICQPGTSNTMENQHSQDILLLDVEPVSSQLGNSQRKDDQRSIVNVNINTNLPVTEPDVSIIDANNQSNNKKFLTKREARKERFQLNQEEVRQEAKEVARQARAYQLPYMVKVAEDLLRKCKNKTLKKKDLNKVKKMMKMENKHQKLIKQFCGNLN